MNKLNLFSSMSYLLAIVLIYQHRLQLENVENNLDRIELIIMDN